MTTELVDLEVDRVDAVDKPATRRKFLLFKSEEPDELRANAEALAKASHDVLTVLAKEAGNLFLSERAARALNALGKLLEFESEFKQRKPKDEEEEEEKQRKKPKDEEEEAKQRKPKDEEEEEEKQRRGRVGYYGYPPPRGDRRPMRRSEDGKDEEVEVVASEEIAKGVAKQLSPVLQQIADYLKPKAIAKGEEPKPGDEEKPKDPPKSKQVPGQDDDKEAIAKREAKPLGKGLFTDVLFGKQKNAI